MIQYSFAFSPGLYGLLRIAVCIYYRISMILELLTVSRVLLYTVLSSGCVNLISLL